MRLRQSFASVSIKATSAVLVELQFLLAASYGMQHQGDPEKTPPGMKDNRCTSNMLSLPGVLSRVRFLLWSQLSTAPQ